jgi:hypothetical protein
MKAGGLARPWPYAGPPRKPLPILRNKVLIKSDVFFKNKTFT